MLAILPDEHAAAHAADHFEVIRSPIAADGEALEIGQVSLQDGHAILGVRLDLLLEILVLAPQVREVRQRGTRVFLLRLLDGCLLGLHRRDDEHGDGHDEA